MHPIRFSVEKHLQQSKSIRSSGEKSFMVERSFD